MSKRNDYIFVLWGNRFEEAAATILVTELRQAGLRVKIVGLSPHPITGLHGLTLMPDLNLDEALALANRAICLVIPCAAANFKQLLNDPRLSRLFRRVHSNRATVVMGCFDRGETHISGLRLSANNTLFYPRREYLVQFARRLVNLLSGHSAAIENFTGRSNAQVYC